MANAARGMGCGWLRGVLWCYVLWTSAAILGQGIGELREMAETRLREAYGV